MISGESQKKDTQMTKFATFVSCMSLWGVDSGHSLDRRDALPIYSIVPKLRFRLGESRIVPLGKGSSG